MPNPQRYVHPSIAAAAVGGAIQHGPSPKLAYADGVWNHGEGFGAAGAADSGGWFAHDNGTGVTSADVHLWQNALWTQHAFSNTLHPQNGAIVNRLQGYLRPAAISLPTSHPRYGVVGSYVDSGAFEIFRPTNTYANQKVLIVIQCSATTGFPSAWVGRVWISP